MRFTIKRDEFLKGLMTASRAVNSKMVADPVLTNLKIELDERGLFITGSNNELTIKSFTPYSKNDAEIIRNYKEGIALINSKIITEIARKMDSEEISLEIIDTIIAIISDNKSEYRINCVKPEDYPDLDLDPSGVKLTLSRNDFSAIVSQTAFAASIKEQRPILTALNLEASEGLLTAIATDAARMARKQIQISSDISFIANIPAKTMIEIDHLLEDASTIDIDISEKKALFTFGGTVILTRMIGGEYPNTKNIVPKLTNYSLEVKTSEFVKAVERANILSVDRENVVDLHMTPDSVEISAKSSQIGSAVEKIEMFKFDGDNLQISFNSEFVLSAIRSFGSEDVVFEFVGEMKPFVVKNPADDSVIQIVTPVRTY